MNHEYFKDRISAYFDRELKPEEERMIAEHLAECAECRQLLAEFEKFDNMVERQSGLKDDLYWEQAAQKIEQAIEPVSATEVTDIKPSAWKGLRWKLAGVAAAAVALAFISLYQSDILEQLQPDDGVRMQTTIPPDTVAKTQAAAPKTEHDYVPAQSIPRPVYDDESTVKDDEKLEAGRDALAEPAQETQETVSKEKKPLEVSSVTKQADEAATVEVKEQVAAPTLNPQKPTIDKRALRKELTAEPESAAKDIPVDVLDEDISAEMPAVGTVINKSGEVFVRGASIPPSDSDVSRQLGFNALAEDTVTLAGWRDKRDQLWEESKKSQKEASPTIDLTSNMADKPTAKRMTVPETPDSQKMLLLCYYNIARLTSDSTEYNASVDSLKSYLTRDDAHYAPEARGYLELLEKDK